MAFLSEGDQSVEQQLRLTPPPAPDVLMGRLRVIARSMRACRDAGASRVVAPSDITDLEDAADVLEALVAAKPVGANYCTVHAGICNDDERSCDFRVHDDETDEDGEPRECALVALIPALPGGEG